MLQAELQRVRQRKEAWRAGQVGEERIAAILSGLPTGWWVLHDRRKASRSPANIDHIAIGPSGVHIIDAKNWSGQLRVSERGVMCGRWPRNEETASVHAVAGLIADELAAAGFGAPVYSVIALANPDNTTGPVVHDGVAFLPPASVLPALTGTPETLTPEQVYRIWELLDDQHPPRTASAIASATPAALRPPRSPQRPAASRGRTTATAAKRANARQRKSGNAVLRALGGVFVALFAIGLLEHAVSGVSRLTPSVPATSPASGAASTQTAAPRSGSVRGACSLVSAHDASALLGHRVRTKSPVPGLCEYRIAAARRPLAVVGYTAGVDQARWSRWLWSAYGTNGCGSYVATPRGHGVGACVDTSGGRVSTAAAWRFDETVTADAQ